MGCVLGPLTDSVAVWVVFQGLQTRALAILVTFYGPQTGSNSAAMNLAVCVVSWSVWLMF